MIAEALEAAWMVASTLAVWIVIGAAVGTLLILGAMAGVRWAVSALRRTVHRLLGTGRGSGAPVSDEPPEDVPRLPPPRERRHTPRWALPPGEAPDERKRSEAA